MQAATPAVTREILWNIDIPEPARTILMAVLSLVPVVFIVLSLRKRWAMWRAIGTPEPMPPRREWGWRARRVVQHALGARRLRRRRYQGAMHSGILYGFIALFIGTVIVAIQKDIAEPLFDWYFFHGNFYRVYSLALELAGLAGIVGCAMALWRRYMARPESLGGIVKWTPSLWLLLTILVTGFMLEGARIAAHPDSHAYERLWSFVGYGTSLAIPQSAAAPVHLGLWWFHLFISIWFLSTFGSTAMAHIFTTVTSIFLAREIPSGASPAPIPNIEEAETFGVLSIEQFNQRHLRDADSCVECGRCQDVCPAFATGKPLSPKRIVGQLRHGWMDLVSVAARGEELPAEDARTPLVGGLITPDELWSCTTCGACERECPAMIEQIEKIVEMRRGLVLMKSEFPEELQNLFSNLEQSGNPWGKDPDERLKWTEDLGFDVPVVGDEAAEGAEYLFWVGCAGALDARSVPITRSIARLMHRAGVKFAILGPAEMCTGDSALRLGNEYLYQVMAKQNIELLQGSGAKKIVTGCPHCLQTISKDYKALGAEFDVVHHSQLISSLRAEGRLSTGDTEPARAPATAIHDSCYLARHNQIVEAPRTVVEMANGTAPTDPPRHGEKGFCCGAGGGRMWMEEKLGDKNVNVERAEELLATGATEIATACPFCKTMISDGVKALGREKDVRVLDVAEALDRRFAPEAEAKP